MKNTHSYQDKYLQSRPNKERKGNVEIEIEIEIKTKINIDKTISILNNLSINMKMICSYSLANLVMVKIIVWGRLRAIFVVLARIVISRSLRGRSLGLRRRRGYLSKLWHRCWSNNSKADEKL